MLETVKFVNYASTVDIASVIGLYTSMSECIINNNVKLLVTAQLPMLRLFNASKYVQCNC